MGQNDGGGAKRKVRRETLELFTQRFWRGKTAQEERWKVEPTGNKRKQPKKVTKKKIGLPRKSFVGGCVCPSVEEEREKEESGSLTALGDADCSALFTPMI